MDNQELRRKSFISRMKSSLSADIRRMSVSKTFYILLAASLLMPVLILVMTTSMGSSEEGTAVAYTSVWQAVESVSGSSTASMDMMSMCNINLIYFLMVVLAGLFISADFRSGFAKNYFTLRPDKSDYVLSKIIVLSVSGMLMLSCYVLGAVLGGAIAGLSFEMEGVTAGNILMCILSKLFFMPVMVSIFTLVCVIARSRTWLSILGSAAAGMLLFTMISMVTPLNATVMNVGLTLAGGILFGAGFGILGKFILGKLRIV